MLLILIVILVVLFLFYIKFQYFTLRGPIPGIPPQLFFGNLIQIGILRGEAHIDIYGNLKKRFGDCYQLWLSSMRFIVVNNVTDVQHIFTHRNIYDQGDAFSEQFSAVFPDGLICLRGAKFKRHAAVTASIFNRRKIISNFDLIVDCVDKLLDVWRGESEDHIYTDLVHQSQNFFLAIFGQIAFDYNLETIGKKENDEFLEALRDVLNVMQVVYYLPRRFLIIYLKLHLRYQRARRIVQKHLNRMIEQELNQPAQSRLERKRTSLIASLVASLQQDEKAEAMKKEEDRKGLSRNEVINEVLLFVVAGYETTSSALSWFIYLISQNPRVQEKIKAELKGEDQRQDFSLNRLNSLVYLDCVIKEVLRLYPPANVTARTLIADDRLPASGTQLFKGEQVLISFDNLARDPLNWSIDPKLFYPERFLSGDQNHHPYALIPFGAGHRQCIGQELARFELKVIAARLMQHITFTDAGAEMNSGGYLVRLTVMPKNLAVKIRFDREK